MESRLPIEFVQKEEKRDPSTSLVIVIDTSGSMTGVRVQLAKEVARLAMRRLLPHDKVGIVEFYGAKRWAAPLQPASNAIELQRALNRMDAGGGTVILPALEEAFYGLQNVDTRYKHVLVLTDGGVESGDFESLMRRMAKEGINVSTVLAGGGYHSEFLVNIANWGKGRFYNVPDRFNLPEILLKQPSTTKLPAYRPGIHLVQARGGPGWWGDISTSTIPNLAGYVESKARIGGEVLLETVEEKHPILATWRYGLGRVTTMMTEPLGAGTEGWRDWPEYGRAISRILERTSADTKEPFRFRVVNDGSELTVLATRQLPRATSSALPVVKWLPDNTDASLNALKQSSIQEFVSLNMEARSPDHFIARLAAPPLGESYRFLTSSTSTPSRWSPLLAKSSVTEETRADPMRVKEWAGIVASVGGSTYTPDGDWLNAPVPSPTGQNVFSTSSWLFGLALALFLVELAWRRWPRRTESTAMRRSGRPAAAKAAASLLGLAFLTTSTANAQPTAQEPAAEVKRQLQSIAQSPAQPNVLKEQIESIFNSAVLSDGSLEPTLAWLAKNTRSLDEPSHQALAEVEVHLAAKLGELQRASSLLERLLELQEVRQSRSDLLVWQAKLQDALGNVEEAKSLYQELVAMELSPKMQQSVRLRLALMDLVGQANPRGSAGKSSAKPLIELAQKSDDVGFKNRAANVLAVQNQHAEAIKLFTIQGEGTDRFRSASRVAEWAIRAKDREKAIEASWIAVDSAQLKRDRNYALALLVESHRMKEKKKGLETLVAEFRKRDSNSASMTGEMRRVWIDLLRELGKYDEAIELFQASANDTSGFSTEMRRELLEMEGEAGYRDRMLASYRKLIAAEPEELAWRAGLTQLLLEEGSTEKAEQLWQEFIRTTSRGSLLLMSAQTLGEFGMDALCLETIERMVELRTFHGQALLYWADLQSRRGDIQVAESTLNRVQALQDVGDDVRAELASAFERLGRQDKAIEVNEAIRASRESVAEDLEMRLAWLYSEVGDEDKALDQWLDLWRKITSIPRRRYVEDRLMTVASRLGKLADIAIELEEKLADQTADDREAGLLVRIYSRVNDAVAATEISEEYMSQSGKREVEQLQEKARIYQICNDYWNYEKVVERLIEVDPEGRTEYLRQLALSMLERGKAQEARAVLMTLRDADDGEDSIGGEFEAGVLSLVGMNREAAQAYRKGIATYPDRIESYLLLANLLKEMGQTERAVGMFQYLAENAEKDDLFTIAIDGILNMEARGPAMQWARRITLERLAGKEDKNYLYQLLADLSFEVNDRSGQIRALENSLAVSGTRRLSVLRECMELSSRIRGGVYYSSSSRGPTNKGNAPFFAYGRRLIGLGELMPPQVFLSLGQAFLDDGDTQSAERTFGMARNLADPRSYQREVALIFEKANKNSEALVRYEKLLRTSPSDVALIARIAKLNELEGKDEIAYRFYIRGLNLLLAQTPLTTQEESSSAAVSYWSSNRDAYQTYSQQLLVGALVTVPDSEIDRLIDSQLNAIRKGLEDLQQVKKIGREAKKLSESPRLEKQSTLARQICFSFDRLQALDILDRLLVQHFVEDKNLLVNLARQRITRGRYDSLEQSMANKAWTSEQRESLKKLVGDTAQISETKKLSPKEMWQLLLPAWMAGDREEALSVLRRVDPKRGSSPGARVTYVIVNGMAVPQTMSGASDVTAWMRLAVRLGDDSLALQFARNQVQVGGRYNGPQFRQQLQAFEKILPASAYGDLVRYTANLIQEDQNRVADFLWLIHEERQYLEDMIPGDEKLLEIIEDGKLEIGYYFPFPLALEVLPESIRAEALASMLSTMVDKYRPRELIQVPFTADQPIDEATADVVLEWLESGIQPAMQDDYLRYCTYSLPRNGTALRCPENADFAIRALDLLLADNVRKKEKLVPRIATSIKAVVLHQSGKTQEAVQLFLSDYKPQESVTDYYHRNSQTWALSELVPAATEAFLEHMDATWEGNKPSVALTDKKISLATQANQEKLLRATYLKAMEDHPEQTKFVTAYERWEQRLGRTLAVCKLLEQRIADANANQENAKTEEEKKKAATQVAKVPSLQTRLASLYQSVNHLPKALPYWVQQDDRDIKRFEQELSTRRKAEEKRQAEEAAKERPPSPDTTKPRLAVQKPAPGTAPQPNNAASKPKANPPATSASTTAEARPGKTYPATMNGVKSAVEDEAWAAATRTLRKIWRTFPPVVETPYYYNSQKRVNGLTWPMTATKTAKTETKAGPTEEEKQEAARQARLKARGGLAVFVPPEPVKRPAQTNAWQKLTEYPFGVSEMQRLVRSKTDGNLSTIRDVNLALLAAERKQTGDEALFDELVAKIQAGNVSEKTLMQFFAIVEEDYSRIQAENRAVIDSLLQRLDITNTQYARQLARLCAETQQDERARALFRQCAMFSGSNSSLFRTLVNEAKQSYEGETLLDLAESMFELTSKSSVECQQILELRAEILAPEQCAEISREILAGRLNSASPAELELAISAAVVFAKARDYERATSCLKFLVEYVGQPMTMPNLGYVSYSPRNTLRWNRRDLIRLFPDSPEDYSDYQEWLAVAAKSIGVQENPASSAFVTELLLTIALRQCQADAIEAAQTTLDQLHDDLLASAPNLHALAMDIFQLSELPERALELEESAFENGQLTHLRFGDLLRHTAKVHGYDAASKRLDQLAEISMDQDLLAAAQDLAKESPMLLEQANQLQQKQDAAAMEFETRKLAAAKRAEQRKKWKEADAAARAKATAAKPKASANAANAAKRASTTSIRAIPAMQLVPASRATSKP